MSVGYFLTAFPRQNSPKPNASRRNLFSRYGMRDLRPGEDSCGAVVFVHAETFLVRGRTKFFFCHGMTWYLQKNVRIWH